MDWAVLFDMDGVLVVSGDAHFEGWRITCRAWGVEMSRAFFDETFGQRNDTIIPRLLGRPATPQEIERFSREKELAYRVIVKGQIARGEITAVPGAVDLVGALGAVGVPMAVASSAPVENVELILGALGIRGALSAVVSAGDVKRGKPDPEVFLTAAARLGHRPARCVVVEDAPDGVTAARGAGMACLAVATTRPVHLLTGAGLVHPDLTTVTVATLRSLLPGR